jgi:hypothetical protein
VERRQRRGGEGREEEKEMEGEKDMEGEKEVKEIIMKRMNRG